LAFEKIKYLDYAFPQGFDEDAKDLITQIFVSSLLRIIMSQLLIEIIGHQSCRAPTLHGHSQSPILELNRLGNIMDEPSSSVGTWHG